MVMSNVGYSFRFYPTKQQEQQLAKNFGCARFVYNHCLRMRNLAYQRRDEKLNSIALSRHITRLKKTKRYIWLNAVPASILVQSLLDLDKAFVNYFKKLAKRPKYKKKKNTQHIRFQLDQRCVVNNYMAGKKLKLTRLGELKVIWSRIPKGTPKMVTVTKTAAHKYFVSFSCEEEIGIKAKTYKEIGIDVGIKDVIVTSENYRSGAPKNFYKYARELKLAQRGLSRKNKGSNRYKKQAIKVARIHEKIANCRRDFLHKETCRLITENDVIYLEDLNVAGMLQNRKLSKAVADVGMFELKRQLEYKAKWYGKEVVIISRWEPTTKTCSSCRAQKEMKLSDRVYSCHCGLIIDRDLNAALNIKAAGRAARGAVNKLGTELG